MKIQKVAVVGAFDFDIYEEAACAALERLGMEVTRIAYGRRLRTAFGRMERRWSMRGPATKGCEALVRHRISECGQLDVILMWRPTIFSPRFVRSLRTGKETVLCCYNNDDPFSSAYAAAPFYSDRRWAWRKFVPAIPEYDAHFVYRDVNIDEFISAGARFVRKLPSYFIPKIHRPIQLGPEEAGSLKSDAVFVGHYEPDGRAEALRALSEAGMRVAVWGSSSWTIAAARALGPKARLPIVPAEGDAYAKVLSAASVGLAFLSKRNRDTYTRRHFEIPACGTAMVSEYTAELAQLYTEDVEAVFFRSITDLVRKVKRLVEEPELRSRIATSGRERAIRSGYDVDSRFRAWLNDLAYVRNGLVAN